MMMSRLFKIFIVVIDQIIRIFLVKGKRLMQTQMITMKQLT